MELGVVLEAQGSNEKQRERKKKRDKQNNIVTAQVDQAEPWQGVNLTPAPARLCGRLSILPFLLHCLHNFEEKMA